MKDQTQYFDAVADELNVDKLRVASSDNRSNLDSESKYMTANQIGLSNNLQRRGSNNRQNENITSDGGSQYG